MNIFERVADDTPIHRLSQECVDFLHIGLEKCRDAGVFNHTPAEHYDSIIQTGKIKAGTHPLLDEILSHRKEVEQCIAAYQGSM